MKREVYNEANRCHCYSSDRVSETSKDTIAGAVPTHAAKDLPGFLL